MIKFINRLKNDRSFRETFLGIIFLIFGIYFQYREYLSNPVAKKYRLMLVLIPFFYCLIEAYNLRNDKKFKLYLTATLAFLSLSVFYIFQILHWDKFIKYDNG